MGVFSFAFHRDMFLVITARRHLTEHGSKLLRIGWLEDDVIQTIGVNSKTFPKMFLILKNVSNPKKRKRFLVLVLWWSIVWRDNKTSAVRMFYICT